MAEDLLPFIVIGLSTGAVYGLAGTGLLLTYKASGIFNFAYGSVAALAAFVFYWLHVEHGLAWPLAALICLLILAPVEGILFELLGRVLEQASATLRVVATIGLLLIVLGIGTIWYGGKQLTFPKYLPASTVRMFGVNVGWDQIIVFVVALAATAALYWFFRFARLGIAMRGVVDNAELLSLTGEDPLRVRRWAWIIGSVFASAAGLLLAPRLSLDAFVLTMLVAQAFGAAAIGYFSNLPLTFAGGLLVGVAGAFATKYVVSVSWLSGLPAGLPFIVLFGVLLLTPRRLLAERRVIPVVPVRATWHAPVRVRLVFAATVIAALLFVPHFAGPHLVAWSSFLVAVMLFASLGLLVRTAGQISLCHLGFAAVGAAAFGHLITDWHLPWLVALLLGGLVAVPAGALIAIPATRLSGVFLALATFGFGILLDQMVYKTGLMFGSTGLGLPTPRPSFSVGSWDMSTDNGFYYLLLLAAVITVCLVVALEGGRLGRLLSALADSPVAMETHGAAPNVTRVIVFCASAAIAATAGALSAALFSFGLPDNYSWFNSLVMVALVVIMTAAEPWFAVLAAAAYSIVPSYITTADINAYLQIVFGCFAAVFALQQRWAPQVPAAVRAFADRLGGRASAPQRFERPARPSAPAVASPAPRQRTGLEVRGLSVRYGSVQAVHDLTLTAPLGTVTGLIGPNGAGKTSAFNACSGLVRTESGEIVLHGTEVTRASAARRARLGLGRSFQRPQLFDSLTVRQNVRLGREAGLAGGSPVAHLTASRRQMAIVADAAEEAMELAGVAALADLQAGLLTSGQKRLVELARLLAGTFDVLLLDEPSAGLDAHETRRFGAVLADVVRDRDMGVLLVEHDMVLVRLVCQNIYVLDFGSLIFEGRPDDLLASEAVRAAYLGAASSASTKAAAGA